MLATPNLPLQNATKLGGNTPRLIGESPCSGDSPSMAWLVVTGSHFSTMSLSLHSPKEARSVVEYHASDIWAHVYQPGAERGT